MDEVARLLSYKINELANRTGHEEPKRSTHQRTVNAQEVRTAFDNGQRSDLYD